ncbi:MAG: ABC transporter permease [Thermoplasmatota archaeon]
MNPKRIWGVFLVNLRSLYRDKGGLFFTFLFPIMLMLLFGFIFQGSGEENYTMHVQDLDGTESSKELTEGLGSVGSIDLKLVGNRTDVDSYMDEERVNFLIIIPEGYGEELTRKVSGSDPNSTTSLIVKFDPSVSSTAIKMSILERVLQEMNKEIGNVTDTVLLQEESIVSEDFTYIDFFIPGVIGLTVMSSAVFGTIFGEMELKQKGVFRKLSTTPITRGEWMLSNMLFQLFIAVLSIALILFIGWLVFGAVLHINYMLVVIVVLEAFFFTGLALIVTRFVNEPQAASAVGNVITFPMMFLSGTFFEVASMPKFIQFIAKGLPLYYVNEGLRESMIFNDMMDSLSFTWVIGILAMLIFIAGMVFTSWKVD